ncbi:GGDEF domain-containing protein [Vibrio cholerae]|uniref:GGDEF domain-containing protein n=1 Tax=Vibrio cholerae TaxID=666 RepID=UPI00115A001F|nr:GGDEF domain-containing protein [Vibrio cholerae]TQQ54324.1 GGDEF domain-containing protein [Vibrio cholerae]
MSENHRYYTILDSLPDHIFIFSESGRYVDVFGGAENETGFDCKDFIGRHLHDILPSEMADEFLGYINRALSANTTQRVKYKFEEEQMIELPAHVPKPMQIWFEGIIKPLPLLEGEERTVIWTAKNITQQQMLEQRLKILSEMDTLTEVHNRRSFSSLLSQAIKEYDIYGVPFSLILFDIDKFKWVNDTLGHPAGDDVIKYVVKVIQQELHLTDVIGRLGGEEFGIILRDSDNNKAFKVAEQLRIRLAESMCELETCSVRVTISLGVTQIMPKDSSMRHLISRADKAMYYSKMHGRNQTCCYETQLQVREA